MVQAGGEETQLALGMARKTSNIDSLTKLFDESSRPIYAIDAERRIVYCNRALATWLDIEARRIIGRVVEYHSEPTADEDEARDDGAADGFVPAAAGVCRRGVRGNFVVHGPRRAIGASAGGVRAA